MKRTLYLLLTAAAGTAVYVTAYAAKRQLFPSSIPFTESIWLMLVLLPPLVACAVLLCRKQVLTVDAAAAVVAIFVLSCLCFALTVPAVFDRSVSLHLLASLADRERQGATEEEIEQEFVAIWFAKHRAIRKRLHEQVAIGFVARRGDVYCITGTGHRFVALARALGAIYHLDSRVFQPHRDVRREPRAVRPAGHCA